MYLFMLALTDLQFMFPVPTDKPAHLVPNDKPAHPVPADKPAQDKLAEEIKPRAREWEKHKAPWMEELKLNQAKKTSYISDVGKSRSVSSSSDTGMSSKAGGGSTDRLVIVDCSPIVFRSTKWPTTNKCATSALKAHELEKRLFSRVIRNIL